jgi:steroid 5-alpha reductase family enzyme
VSVSPFPWTDFFTVTAGAASIVALLMAIVALHVRRGGRIAVVDVVWGTGFIVVAVLSSALGELLRPQGDQRVRLALLVGMVTVWGGRLAWHIARRSRGAGEDPRYERLMASGSGGVVRKVLLPQGIAIWFVSLPVQVSAVSTGDLGVWTWLGVAGWLVGMVFESVSDAQLTAYKKNPDRTPVMDRGLWRYTRHPNYFGDACVWWGIWLVAADAWPGVLTVLSPAAMTYFLVFATGARLLERSMMKRKGYPEYAERTSMFFPLPPRTRTARR